jgi:hypothetical protein
MIVYIVEKRIKNNWVIDVVFATEAQASEYTLTQDPSSDYRYSSLEVQSMDPLIAQMKRTRVLERVRRKFNKFLEDLEDEELQEFDNAV